MNENTFEVKEKRSGYFAKGIIFLVLAVITLFVALFPYAFPNLKINSTLFLILGGTGFVAFAILFVSHLNRECVPSNAMVLTDNGFTHYGSTGDLEIEWTNVASIRLYGQSDSPCLGIYLENVDIVIAKLKTKYSDTLRFNIEEGLAPILVYQSDVRIKLSRLKDILTEYVRNSRSVDKKEGEKSKHNPFTTEDVLRAFGKLPQDDAKDISDEATVSEDTPVNNEPSSEFYDALNELSLSEDNPKDEITVPENEEDSSEDINGSNAFPSGDTIIFGETNNDAETINEREDEDTSEPIAENVIDGGADANDVDEIAAIMTETNGEDDKPLSDDELPEEFMDLLSRAKSTKINELEKILNEKDIPYSYGRTDKIAEAACADSTSSTTFDEAEIPSEEVVADDVLSEPEQDEVPEEVVEKKAKEQSPIIDNTALTFVTEVHNIPEASEEKTSDLTPSKDSVDDIPVFDVPKYEVDGKESDAPDEAASDISFELTLEAMINDALDKKKASTKKEEPINLDNSIFESADAPKDSKKSDEYPELIFIDDSSSDKKNNKDDEDDDFIIPNLNDDE